MVISRILRGTDARVPHINTTIIANIWFEKAALFSIFLYTDPNTHCRCYYVDYLRSPKL